MTQASLRIDSIDRSSARAREGARLASRRALCVLALAGLCSLAPSGAAAQADDEAARVHFEAGQSYFEQARYVDAAREFMASYELSERPALLLNASLAYERALDFERAIALLERFLDRETEIEDRRTFEIRLEGLRALHLRMQSREADAPSVETPSEGLGELGAVGIIVAAIGAAAGVVALSTGLVAHDTYGALQARCDASAICPPGSQGDIDTGYVLAVTSTVASGVALLGLGAGLALLLIDLTSGPPTGPVALVPGPGELGAGLAWSF